MGGRAPDRPPEAPAQRHVNIPALALPDRPHHGPRYKIFTWRWPPPAGREPSQITEPCTFCLCDAPCSRPHSVYFNVGFFFFCRRRCHCK